MTVRRRDERGGFKGSERDRLALIASVCEARPLYVDVELSTAEANPGWFEKLPREPRKIVSWHDFDRTPALSTLKKARAGASSLGDIAKVVTTAKRERGQHDSPAALRGGA